MQWENNIRYIFELKVGFKNAWLKYSMVIHEDLVMKIFILLSSYSASPDPRTDLSKIYW